MKKKSLDLLSLNRRSVTEISQKHMGKIVGGAGTDTDVDGGASCETCSACNEDSCACGQN